MCLCVDQIMTINILLKRNTLYSTVNLDIIVDEPMMSLLSCCQRKTSVINCCTTSQSYAHNKQSYYSYFTVTASYAAQPPPPTPPFNKYFPGKFGSASSSGFCPFVLKQNLWDEWLRLFTGQRPFTSLNEQCPGSEESTDSSQENSPLASSTLDPMTRGVAAVASNH